METKDTTKDGREPKDCTPERLNAAIPPLEDLVDALFRGFAPEGARGREGRP